MPGTAAYAQAQSMAANAPATAISADTLSAGAKPLSVPKTPNTPPIAPAVPAAPDGTNSNEDGTVSVPPPSQNPANDAIKSILGQDIGSIGGEGKVRGDAESAAGVDSLTASKASAYNAYITAKNASDSQIAQMRATNPDGEGVGRSLQIDEIERQNNANVSNLLTQYQASSGALTDAQNTVDTKINNQFQPIKDQISALEAFNTVNNADLTDSDKEKLTENAASLKTASASVQTAAQDIHSTLLKNGAPASAYSAIDAITSKYTSGQIDAATAQSQMYAAAGPYGVAQGDVPGISGNLPVVSMGATGAPDPASQAQFLSSLPTDVATLVKGIANYQINLNTSPQKQYKGASGLTEAQMASLVSQYDPTWSQSQFATRQALQTNFASGAYSKNINALNTAIGHLSDIQGNSAALNNKGFVPYNAVKNAALNTFGSGSVTSASTNLSAAAGEMAGTFKTGGATDKEVEALSTITPNSSPAQMKSYVQTGINLLASRLSALSSTYESGMGRPPASSFLSPQNMATLSSLKDQGFQIDIPGVHFTDPVAYAKADTSNADELDAVRRQFPDMSPADALAQAQYNQDNGY